MVIKNSEVFKNKIPLLKRPAYEQLGPDDVAAARAYIASYWPKLTRFHPKDNDTLIGLPKPYLVPAYAEGHEFDFNEMYYWDSYFMVQGLAGQQHKDLILGVLEDLVALYKRCHIIPNASRTYLTGRSQPPMLSSFIMEAYQAYNLDKKWLQRMMATAKDEYQTVWMGTTKPNARLVFKNLSRYYDINYLNDLAEAESGWDMTPRFSRRALNFLPVDLNSLLYKYETDFAATAQILGDKAEAARWKHLAKARAAAMHGLMWSDLRGFFYDYNYVKQKRGNVNSLAAYYTMWAGLASAKQAKKLVAGLKKFEQKGGLATTDGTSIGQLVPGALPNQWAYPNGWAPLHYLTIKGLQRYGYHDEARRIALKWIKTNNDWFARHGVFLEKYNVAQPSKPPMKGLYPSQTGFGWTNGVFERLCQEYIDNQ